MGKKEFIFLLLLVLAALFIRGFFLSQVRMIFPDEAYYLGMARSMAEGRDYAGFDPTPFQRTETNLGRHQGQPFLPVLLSWTTRAGKDPVLAGQWTSVAASILALILFHFCVRHFGTPGEALVSDAVYVFSPVAIRYSYLVMNHSLFFLFLFAFLLFALKAAASGRLTFAVLAGVAAWGAYLTRLEAIFLVGLLVLFTIFLPLTPTLSSSGGEGRVRGVKFFLIGIFVTSFLLLCLPVWVWIRKTTGIWQLDWSLTQGVPAYLVASRAGFPGLQAFWPAYFHRLGESLWTAVKVFPAALLVLVGPGVLEVFSRKKPETPLPFLILPFVVFPFLFYPAVNNDPRFYAPALLFLYLFAGPGVSFLIRKIKRRKAVVLGCLLLAPVSFFPGYRSLVLGFGQEPLEQKKMGEWIAQNYAEPQVILVSDIRSCFYAGPRCRRRFSPLRMKEEMAAGRLTFERFLEKNQIDLIAVDLNTVEKFHPHALFLLNDPPAFLKKAVEWDGEKQRIVLYQYDPGRQP